VTAFCNLLLSPADFAQDEWKAAQIPADSPERDSAERELCQFVWAIPYTPPKVKTEIELDATKISNRRLVLPRAQLPEDTDRLAVGIDLGSTQGWYAVLAERLVDGERRFHIPDYDMFDVPSHDRPIKDAITDALIELYAVLRAGWVVKGTGEVLHAAQVWIDAGYFPDAVYPVVKRLTGYELSGPVIASLGRGESTMKRSKYSAPKKSGNTVRQVDPAGLWYVERVARAETLAVVWDTDYSKLQVHQALSLEAGHPGSVTLFAGTSKTHDRLTRHLMNEQLQTVEVAGQPVKKWKRTGANHLLDCIAAAKRGLDRAAYLPEIQPWHELPEFLTRAMLDEEAEEEVWVYPE
jgi:phage terminase large subunit GpA-like protein